MTGYTPLTVEREREAAVMSTVRKTTGTVLEIHPVHRSGCPGCCMRFAPEKSVLVLPCRGIACSHCKA